MGWATGIFRGSDPGSAQVLVAEETLVILATDGGWYSPGPVSFRDERGEDTQQLIEGGTGVSPHLPAQARD